MGLMNAINHRMHEGRTCPTAGSLGECCGIWLDSSNATHAHYYAAVYLWTAAEGMPFAEVARWFKEAAGIGDDDVRVHLIVHDTDNDTHEGRCHDGARPLGVEFTVPLDRAAALGMELPTEPPGPEASPRLSAEELMGARAAAPNLTVQQIEEIAALPVDQLQVRLISALAGVRPINPAWLHYSHERDELVIHGKRYAAAMFGPEGWAAPVGTVLQICEAEPDVLALRRIDYEPDPQARWHRAMAQEDDCHVADAFLDQVKGALRRGREKGRGGWQTADVAEIHAGLHKSLAAGYPVDVAAYCMFLWSRGDRTEPAQAPEWKVGPLTPAAAEILGRICTQCIRIAQLLRASGKEIATRAEAEQAAVIHYLLSFYATHGDDWAQAAEADLKAKAEALARKEPQP